jgi:hypothetical protein
MKIRTGIAGLERLGWLHAENLRHRIPQAELVAACDPDPVNGKRPLPNWVSGIPLPELRN